MFLTLSGWYPNHQTLAVSAVRSARVSQILRKAAAENRPERTSIEADTDAMDWEGRISVLDEPASNGWPFVVVEVRRDRRGVATDFNSAQAVHLPLQLAGAYSVFYSSARCCVVPARFADRVYGTCARLLVGCLAEALTCWY